MAASVHFRLNEPVSSKQLPGAATTMGDFRAEANERRKKAVIALSSEEERFPKGKAAA